MQRVMVLGVSMGLLLALAHVAVGHRPSAGTTSLWADGCAYRTSSDSDRNGAYTTVTAVVWKYGDRWNGWRTQAVADYNARQAVAAFDCERVF